MRAARIVSLFFAFFVGLFLIFPKTSFAQNYYPTQAGNYNAPNTNPDVPKNLHTYTQSVFLEMLASLTCIVGGFDPISQDQKCLGYDTKTGKIGYSEKNAGLIGISGNLIAMTYTPPINTGDYVNYLANNFGVVKKTYAASQGVGFEGIRPLLNIWVIFRNVVYLLFVLVFVIIGIAIMLRVKIDPRTVMTLQNQLPRIIIALILVTFSFAIAGILIDLMWIFCFLILSLFSDPGFNSANAAKNMMNTPFGFLSGLDGVSWATIPYDIGKIVENIVKHLLDGTGLGGGSWLNPANWFSNILGFIAGIAAFLIILITVTIALFRLWFSLIQAYVMILLSIIIGPFWIMSGVIPGRSSGFGSWLKEILANLAAFPAVIFIFVIMQRIITEYGKADPTSAFIPPLIGTTIAGGAIKGIIAFGLLMATPNLINMIKAAIKAPKLDTGGAMKGVGGALGVVGKPASAGWKRLTRPADPWTTRPEGKLRRVFLGRPIQSGTGENQGKKVHLVKNKLTGEMEEQAIKNRFATSRFGGWRRKLFPTYLSNGSNKSH
jgi:hypothetical protein